MFEFISAVDPLPVFVRVVETEHVTELVERNPHNVPGLAATDRFATARDRSSTRTRC